jgi:putative endonuclease
MSSSTTAIGQSGESRASTYLKGLGFKIIERNWRHRHDEIDIIAEYQGCIVFVEVKTRENNSYGRPEEFVSKKKQRFIIRAANEYMVAKQIDKEVRFDVVAITNKNEANKVELVHLPNAFYPLV